MKNYIKPTAEIVELSVKESLSALPSLTDKRSLTRKAAINLGAATTWYGDEFSTPTTVTNNG